LPVLYVAQRMEAERHHARLRAEAELGIDAPRRGPSGRERVGALVALAVRLAPSVRPRPAEDRTVAGAAPM
jgi:hypothetical protein